MPLKKHSKIEVNLYVQDLEVKIKVAKFEQNNAFAKNGKFLLKFF